MTPRFNEKKLYLACYFWNQICTFYPSDNIVYFIHPYRDIRLGFQASFIHFIDPYKNLPPVFSAKYSFKLFSSFVFLIPELVLSSFESPIAIKSSCFKRTLLMLSVIFAEEVINCENLVGVGYSFKTTFYKKLLIQSILLC